MWKVLMRSMGYKMKTKGSIKKRFKVSKTQIRYHPKNLHNGRMKALPHGSFGHFYAMFPYTTSPSRTPRPGGQPFV